MPTDVTLDGPVWEKTSPDRTSYLPVYRGALGSWRFSLDRRPLESDELARRYDRRSSQWHSTIERFGFEGAYRSLMDRTLHQARYNPRTGHLNVLDAGVGTGAMSRAFHAHINRPFSLTGVDVSAAMLNEAEMRLSPLAINTKLEQADINALPYEDESFDVALVAHVLEHLAEPRVALAELSRVLRPGGVLLCCMTRRSLFGTFVQLKWRTHQVAIPTALGWMRSAGLQSPRAIPLDRRYAARWFSHGYVGLK